MTVPLDGKLWLANMPYRRFPFYEQRLNAACYIVIAYLSGMRVGEKWAELHLMQYSSRRNTGDFRRSDASVGTAHRLI